MLDTKKLTNSRLQQGLTPNLLLCSLNLYNLFATITSTVRANMVTQLKGMALQAKLGRKRGQVKMTCPFPVACLTSFFLR